MKACVNGALRGGRGLITCAASARLRRPLSDQMTAGEIEVMCQHLPKLELHAHLSGTVSESTLRDLCVANGSVCLPVSSPRALALGPRERERERERLR